MMGARAAGVDAGPNDLHAGLMVTPRVRLVTPLGQGGMGRVWVGEHLTLRKEVAVKFVDLDKIDKDPTIVTRFLKEATLTAQLTGPHVVAMLDHGVTDEGWPYIVMERLVGMTLFERLRTGGPMHADELVTIVAQTCRALTEAHRRGVVHRDIKPSNIFLCDADGGEPSVKVLDFGLAKEVHPLTYTAETTAGAIVGTPAYMSPEQALSSKAVDARADLWALSVVAYHALTGRAPFQGETIGSLCVAIANGDFTPPSSLRPALPRSLDRFFARAFAGSIDDRFLNARDLADAFADAVEDRSPEGESPESLMPPSRQSLEGAEVEARRELSARSSAGRRVSGAALVAALVAGLFIGQMVELAPSEPAARPAAPPLRGVEVDSPAAPAPLGDDRPPHDIPRAAPPTSASAHVVAAPPVSPADRPRRGPASTSSKTATGAPPAPEPTPSAAPATGPETNPKESTFWGF